MIVKKEYIRNKPHINVGTLGHVDHGKTSLTSAICRYLSLVDGENNEYISYEKIDKAPEEKKRGITINASVVRYITPQRHVGHVDCPGHADYVKNMITGASQLDGAILVIDITTGPAKQTAEHILLASKLGLKKIIVFWNKNDIPFDREDFELSMMDVTLSLESKGFDKDFRVIEGSALAALNAPADPNHEAFKPIKELVEAIDSYFDVPERDLDAPALLPIESILSISGRGTVVTGKVEKGTIKTGDSLELIGLQKNKIPKNVVCKEIETFLTKTTSAIAGDNVGILLSGVDKSELTRGQCLVAKGKFSTGKEFIAQLYVSTKDEGGRNKPFETGYEPQFFIRTADVTGRISLIEDKETGIVPKFILPGDNVEINVTLQKDVCLHPGLSFTIREGGITVGAGIVTKVLN